MLAPRTPVVNHSLVVRDELRPKLLEHEKEQLRENQLSSSIN